MIDGNAQDGQTLTTHHSIWYGDPTSFSYQWYSCDAAATTCDLVPRCDRHDGPPHHEHDRPAPRRRRDRIQRRRRLRRGVLGPDGRRTRDPRARRPATAAPWPRGQARQHVLGSEGQRAIGRQPRRQRAVGGAGKLSAVATARASSPLRHHVQAPLRRAGDLRVGLEEGDEGRHSAVRPQARRARSPRARTQPRDRGPREGDLPGGARRRSRQQAALAASQAARSRGDRARSRAAPGVRGSRGFETLRRLAVPDTRTAQLIPDRQIDQAVAPATCDTEPGRLRRPVAGIGVSADGQP